MPLQTASSLIRYLSDGSPDGTSVAQSSTDLITIYNGTPVVQPSGPAQAALVRGNAAGVIATWDTSQSPASAGVSANTSIESALTIQTGTGATMLAATGDLLFINKPTASAGVGMGNVRPGSAGNLANITLTNFTSATVNIASSEVYKVVALRGLGSFALSATLSPAAVAASSTVEQQFSVTGLAAGSLVQVSKPTSQAGLDIGGCRVVSNNLLGITFVNVTSAAITPTSGQAYSIVALPGLDALNNDVFYGWNVGTVSAATVGTSTPNFSTPTISGLATTDMITGIMKPTQQVTASGGVIAGGVISAANTIAITFASIATWTPTSGEVYGLRTAKLAPVAPLVITTPTLAASSTIAANTTGEQVFSAVSGLIVSSPVWVNKPSYTNGLSVMGCRVTSAGTLAINYGNTTSAAITVPTEAYTVGNFQSPGPGAGNCVYQCVSPTVNGLGNLSNAMRTALGPNGLNAIAGA